MLAMECLTKITLLLVLANSLSANAALPLTTDDAGALISPAPVCQVNVYARHAHNADASEIQPDCNLYGDVELSAAFDRLKPRQASSQRFLTVQGKTVIRPVEPNNWGWGFSAGVVDDVTNKPSVKSAYGNLIYGVSPEDSLQLDFNMGALRNRGIDGDTPGTIMTWAAAVEKDLGPNLTLVGETYGEQHAPSSWQIGVRMPIKAVSNYYMSLAIGNQRGAGRDNAWLQIGFTLILDTRPEPRAGE